MAEHCDERIAKMTSSLEQARARIAVLERALEPFAKLADRINRGADDVWDALGVTVKNGDLRLARDVLSPEKEQT